MGDDGRRPRVKAFSLEVAVAAAVFVSEDL